MILLATSGVGRGARMKPHIAFGICSMAFLEPGSALHCFGELSFFQMMDHIVLFVGFGRTAESLESAAMLHLTGRRVNNNTSSPHKQTP